MVLKNQRLREGRKRKHGEKVGSITDEAIVIEILSSEVVSYIS